MWTTNGVVQDAGGAAGGPTGTGLSELGITNTGLPFCINDAPVTLPYHRLCLGTGSNGTSQITSDALGGATPFTFSVDVNGVVYPFPSPGDTSTTHLATESALLAYAIQTTTVIRDGYYNAGDGGSAVYTLKSGACSLNSGAGDGGSQVPFVGGGKCWTADFAPGATLNVKAFGAVCDGTTDDHSPIQVALTAAGVVKGVAIVPPARCNIAANITIPANTTLQCVNGFTDSEDWIGDTLAHVPALTLAGGSTITASGTGASIKTCMIQRAGMTFPPASSAAYAGLAVSDGGNVSFAMSDSIVLGFGTCVYLTGARPNLRRVYMDCSGNTSVGIRGASFEIDNGNHDAGSFTDIKLQPIATGNANCTTGIRAGGTGVSVNGINTFNGFTITQNFGVSEFEVASGTFVIVNGNLWTDYLAGCSNTAIGVELTGDLHADEVDLNGTFYGIVNNYAGSSSFGTVFLNNIGQDCISAQNGVTKINSLVSNINASISCGRYAVNEPGSTAAIVLIDTAHIFRVNGGSVPYFNNVVTNQNIPGALYVGHLFASDLTPGINPYDGFKLAPGSEDMVSPINVLLGTKCLGLGTGGVCSVTSGSNETSGILNITAGTSGTTATGEVSITFPHPVDNIRTCVFQDYNGGWANPVTFMVDQVSTTETGAVWLNGAGAGTALTASQLYRIIYHCSAT